MSRTGVRDSKCASKCLELHVSRDSVSQTGLNWSVHWHENLNLKILLQNESSDSSFDSLDHVEQP